VGTFVGSMMTHLWLYEGEREVNSEVLPLDSEGPSFSGDGKMAPKTEKAKTNRVYYYGIAVVLIIALAYLTVNYISKQNKEKEIITDTLKPLTKDETKELLSGYLAHLYQPAKPFTPTNVVLSENFSLKSSDDKLNPFSNDYKNTLKKKLQNLPWERKPSQTFFFFQLIPTFDKG